MKKIGIVLMALFMTASCFAGIYVSWSTSYGVLNSQAPAGSQDYDTYTFYQAGDSVYWALIYSSANTLSFDDLAYDHNNNTLVVGGTGTLLAGREIDTSSGAVSSVYTIDSTVDSVTGSLDANLWGPTTLTSATFDGTALSVYTSGYLYQAVFGYNPLTEIVEWFLSPVVAMLNKGAASDDPQVMKLETGTELGASAYSSSYSTAIPEPATMSLLGLGALAMVLRRKIRK